MSLLHRGLLLLRCGDLAELDSATDVHHVDRGAVARAGRELVEVVVAEGEQQLRRAALEAVAPLWVL